MLRFFYTPVYSRSNGSKGLRINCMKVFLRGEVKMEMQKIKEEVKDEIRRTLLSMVATSTASEA